MNNDGAPNLARGAEPRGNPEAIRKLVMAMKLNGLPKESLNLGFLADFEVRQFEEFWALPYVELCKRSVLHAAEALAALAPKPVLTDDDRVLLRSLPSDSSWIKPELLPLVDMGFVEWSKDSDGKIICRLTEAGRAEIAT